LITIIILIIIVILKNNYKLLVIQIRNNINKVSSNKLIKDKLNDNS